MRVRRLKIKARESLLRVVASDRSRVVGTLLRQPEKPLPRLVV
jgi:hypothetical protein